MYAAFKNLLNRRLCLFSCQIKQTHSAMKEEDINEDRYDHLFKIILIGDSGTGKSNLMLRYTQDKFDSKTRTTVGLEFATKTIEYGGKMIKLQVWDTAGQERSVENDFI